MATTSTIDTTGIIAIANQIKAALGSSDREMQTGAENLARIARGLESFEKLNVGKLSSNLTKLSSVSNIVSTVETTLGTLDPRSNFGDLGKKFGKPLRDISTGLEEFSKISFNKVENNLTRLGRDFADIIEEFGIYFSGSTLAEFKDLGDTFGKSLSGISDGLSKFSELSVYKVRSNLTRIGNDFADIIEEFGIYFSGSTLAEFKDLGDTFGKSLGGISDGLSKFSQLSVSDIRDNIHNLQANFEDIISQFVSAFSGSVTEEFKDLGDTFGKSLGGITDGLSKFSELCISDISDNIHDLQANFEDIISQFQTVFGSSVTEEFADLGKTFGESLGGITDGLNKFSGLSVSDIEFNLIQFSNSFSDIIGDFVKVFKGSVTEEFKDLGETFGKPLADISNGFKVFSELSIFDLKKNILLLAFLPGSLKKLAERLSKVGPDLRKASKQFGVPIKSIADGLKTFSGLSIFKLKANIILLGLLPGSLKKLGQQLSDTGPDLRKASREFGKPLAEIAKGLKDLGDLKWGKILFSVIALKLFSKGIVSSLNGLNSLSSIATSAGRGISEVGRLFGNISQMVSTVILNFFTDLGKNIGKIAKGTLAIGLISASLVVFGLALKSLAGIDIASVITGTLALTTLSFVVKSLGGGGIIKGVLAIGLLSAGLFVFAKSLQQFGGVSWKDVLIGSAALAVLTAAMFGLGALVSGPQGLLFLAGIAALTGLGVSLLPAAFAFKMLGEGAQGVSKALSDITPQLSELAQIGPSLLTTAAALGVLSAALVAFSAGSLFSGGAGLFGKILGINPIDKLKELAALGDGLEKTATSLERINSNKNSAGSDLEGMKYDNSNRRTELNSEKDSMGATVVGGGSSTLNNIGGSTVNNTSINQNNIQDRTSYVLSHNMAWTAC
jgi:hypothetical protein